MHPGLTADPELRLTCNPMHRPFVCDVAVFVCGLYLWYDLMHPGLTADPELRLTCNPVHGLLYCLFVELCSILVFSLMKKR